MFGKIKIRDLELQIQDEITEKWYPICDSSKNNLSIIEKAKGSYADSAHFIVNQRNEALLLQLV